MTVSDAALRQAQLNHVKHPSPETSAHYLSAAIRVQRIQSAHVTALAWLDHPGAALASPERAGLPPWCLSRDPETNPALKTETRWWVAMSGLDPVLWRATWTSMGALTHLHPGMLDGVADQIHDPTARHGWSEHDYAWDCFQHHAGRLLRNEHVTTKQAQQCAVEVLITSMALEGLI